MTALEVRFNPGARVVLTERALNGLPAGTVGCIVGLCRSRADAVIRLDNGEEHVLSIAPLELLPAEDAP